jgi:hypothetical protein
MARDLDELWRDPRHWTGRRYRCPEDPRLVVPKLNPALGWTFNWAHPSAGRYFAALLAVGIVPSLLLVIFVLATGARAAGSIPGLAVGDVLVTVAGSLLVTWRARRAS